LAGGPGDRWSNYRKMVGREESPDTVLSHQEMGNAPGNARGAPWVAQASACVGRSAYGKCHREYTAGDAARWHRAGKPAWRLRTARFVWQGWKGGV